MGWFSKLFSGEIAGLTRSLLFANQQTEFYKELYESEKWKVGELEKVVRLERNKRDAHQNKTLDLIAKIQKVPSKFHEPEKKEQVSEPDTDNEAYITHLAQSMRDDDERLGNEVRDLEQYKQAIRENPQEYLYS